MRLLVVSHTPHHTGPNGPAGWGATVRELDRLATLFEEVVHLAPLYDGPAPASSRPYRAENLTLRSIEPTGGPRIRDKLGILARAPAFLRALSEQVRRADVVHLRAPANVAALAMAARPRLPLRPWWVKYAGNWRPHGAGARAEARSYRWQRAWLRRPRQRLAVTVNGRWPGDGPHIRHFLNPCLTGEEWRTAHRWAEDGGAGLPGEKVCLLFVGRLETEKGAGRALEVLPRVPGAELVLAGDGPLRGELEARARERDLRVRFTGWLSRPELDACYRRAHFLLLPSLASEGWPKVVSEAMAWGVVPVTSDVSSLPQILGELGVGSTHPAEDGAAMAASLERLRRPELFAEQRRRASRAAEHFTYGRYLEAVRRLFADQLGVELHV